jgi:hypothetical protein
MVVGVFFGLLCLLSAVLAWIDIRHGIIPDWLNLTIAATEKLSEVLLQLNETSLSQLRRDHETGHLEHKIARASK